MISAIDVSRETSIAETVSASGMAIRSGELAAIGRKLQGMFQVKHPLQFHLFYFGER